MTARSPHGVAERYQSAARLLADVPGLERRSVQVNIAETGAGMSCFPSPAQLASWAGLCPGNHESAGKRRRVATTPGNPWPRRTLIESARAAARTRDSYYGAQYRQIARRRGPNKAAVAVARSLLDVIWHMLTTGEIFTDPGAGHFTSRHDKEHQTRRLVSQLEKLGYTVQLAAAGNVAVAVDERQHFPAALDAQHPGSAVEPGRLQMRRYSCTAKAGMPDAAGHHRGRRCHSYPGLR